MSHSQGYQGSAHGSANGQQPNGAAHGHQGHDLYNRSVLYDNRFVPLRNAVDGRPIRNPSNGLIYVVRPEQPGQSSNGRSNNGYSLSRSKLRAIRAFARDAARQLRINIAA